MVTKLKTSVGILSLLVGLLSLNSFAAKVDKTSNKTRVSEAFNKWIKGTGGPFDLLEENVHWTINGSSPHSKTYTSKKEFMDEVIVPFNKRFTERFKPIDVKGVYADGNQVIVLFDGKGIAKDGVAYQNTYAWFLKFRGEKVSKVSAFFDTRLFDEFWNRVKVE